MGPATNIVARLGGVSAVQKLTGVHRTRVYGWMKSKSAGGTGGLIPQKHIPALLAAGRSLTPPLTADDFLPSDTKQRRSASQAATFAASPKPRTTARA